MNKMVFRHLPPHARTYRCHESDCGAHPKWFVYDHSRPLSLIRGMFYRDIQSLPVLHDKAPTKDSSEHAKTSDRKYLFWTEKYPTLAQLAKVNS